MFDEVLCPGVKATLSEQADAVAASIQLAIADQPPVAEIQVSGPFTCPGSYTVSGQSSSDPDDRGLSRNDIQSYAWSIDGNELSLKDPLITLDVPPGRHDIALTVTDTFGLTGSTFTTIETSDTDPPTAALTLTPNVLWPPNHRMVEVWASLDTFDTCGPVGYRLVSVASNEPDAGCGSGDASPDVSGVDVGAPDTEFMVRAERCGQGNGRTYTVTYEVFDVGGHTIQATGTILVPHDQR